jgi:hypothetical protein
MVVDGRKTYVGALGDGKDTSSSDSRLKTASGTKKNPQPFPRLDSVHPFISERSGKEA